MFLNCTKTNNSKTYKCLLKMFLDSPIVSYQINVSLIQNGIKNLVKGNVTLDKDSYEFNQFLNGSGMFKLLAEEITSGSSISIYLIVDPAEVNFDDMKELFANLMNNENGTGDVIADLFKANPSLLLNMLKLRDQPGLIGCLSNCSKLGKCGITADNRLKCFCNEYYEGPDCSTDTRPCYSSPCQNNATCTNIKHKTKNETFKDYKCECTSDLFYGNKMNFFFNQNVLFKLFSFERFAM